MKTAQLMATALLVICLSAMQGCGGNGASLTVTPKQSAPVITAQPVSQTVQSGQTATFTVTATGSPAPTYQWLLNGSQIAGATNASYTTPALTTANSGAIYTVAVTNSAGAVTSGSATLTVTPAPSAPVITVQPVSQTVQSGQTATFAVTATGSPAPTYQWLLNGSQIGGATNASYTTPALTTANSGAVYTVTVTNTAGSVTSSGATLTVTNIASAVLAPSVLVLTAAQEASITATTPSSVTFSQAVTFAPGAVVLEQSPIQSGIQHDDWISDGRDGYQTAAWRTLHQPDRSGVLLSRSEHGRSGRGCCCEGIRYTRTATDHRRCQLYV